MNPSDATFGMEIWGDYSTINNGESIGLARMLVRLGEQLALCQCEAILQEDTPGPCSVNCGAGFVANAFDLLPPDSIIIPDIPTIPDPYGTYFFGWYARRCMYIGGTGNCNFSP